MRAARRHLAAAHLSARALAMVLQAARVFAPVANKPRHERGDSWRATLSFTEASYEYSYAVQVERPGGPPALVAAMRKIRALLPLPTAR